MHICASVHTRTHTHADVRTHTWMHAHAHTNTPACMHACMHTCFVDRLPPNTPPLQTRHIGDHFEIWDLSHASTVARGLPDEEKYHHIVVDEVQDMPEG